MLVLMMIVPMNMLVGMRSGLVAVLMSVMSMGACLVRMFVLMFIFAVATHLESPPFLCILINCNPAFANVKKNSTDFNGPKIASGPSFAEEGLTSSSRCNRVSQLLGMDLGRFKKHRIE